MSNLIVQFKEQTNEIIFLKDSPLVQCITNEITCESMANALLYIGAKPIMADDSREFKELFQQTDALLLNLGRLSVEREKNLRQAANYARETEKPTVVDLVGVTATKWRFDIGHALLEQHPQVVKGNLSEMRAFCQLATKGRGVDGSTSDQSDIAISELVVALHTLTHSYPETIFLATGPTDIVVNQGGTYYLKNGVPELDAFTGTGDIVGAMIAAFLGDEYSAIEATILAVSYFNLCGEQAKNLGGNQQGLADFRHQTLNQLSLLKEQPQWTSGIKGAYQSWNEV
ncbi:hydroxyethylthiazole kinase [Vagococcus penaei]|uniref:Hydroxyethylthiazole kinase n=1 Tax=Vagococcus penaei TaxID=633807 RepID=A0A1Q2D357_9ENTE|nr:hydroxyethylthiazole kinase [Vagococcus penaei]AQP52771.1 hydroxyethylthiazole kinase [Vagococcus penaei]RST98459.1 hydroxyethylthiazole kinase [Vagococcus penaei]